ncbi:hypothetical protein EK904_003046, partial [Melospiza melodia maxima]
MHEIYEVWWLRFKMTVVQIGQFPAPLEPREVPHFQLCDILEELHTAVGTQHWQGLIASLWHPVASLSLSFPGPVVAAMGPYPTDPTPWWAGAESSALGERIKDSCFMNGRVRPDRQTSFDLGQERLEMKQEAGLGPGKPGCRLGSFSGALQAAPRT